MGNGAALQAEQAIASRTHFDDIETICQSGYFREKDNFPDYKKAVYSAVRHDNLDVLEILISAGNMKKLKPLHVAASMAKLDALEQFLSAGFETTSTDKEGRNPLHMCCYHESHESSLCASFLVLQNKQLSRMPDNTGLMPLHLAVSNRNSQVVKALINNGCDKGIQDRKGRTPLKCAQELGYREMVMMLADYGEISDRDVQPSAFNHSSEVDQERIMKIWETFFENAFKRFDDPNYIMPAAPAAAATRRGGMSKEEKVKAQRKKAYDDQRLMFFDERGSGVGGGSGARVASKSKYPADTTSSKVTASFTAAEKNSGSYYKKQAYSEAGSETVLAPKVPILSKRECLLAWFSWIVFWDEEELALALGNSSTDDNCYYVMHRDTGETRWLASHVELMAEEGVIESSYAGYTAEDIAFVATQPLPTKLYDAMEEYWLTYYDPYSNTCSWMNLPTKSLENYLPLGMGETAKKLAKMKSALNLTPFESDTAWVGADQYVAQSWVVVIIDNYDTGAKEESSAKSGASYKSDAKSNNMWSTEVDSSSRIEYGGGGDQNYGCDEYYNERRQAETTHNALDWYYLNTATNRASWEQPQNWDEVIATWGEWTLCCNEAAPDEIFWYVVLCTWLIYTIQENFPLAFFKCLII